MSGKILLHLVFLPFGIALLFAGLFFQNGFAGSPPLQTTPVPTIDRLAEPTLPSQPSQADYGAQVYWLNCSPCHGDRGQGLTDEFRAQYPPEDQNCWTSHCHGKVTYENGFTIPTVVPQVIGSGSLSKFSTAANLYAFIRAVMPYQKPGSLTDDEYYQIVAFLLRQNGLIESQTQINAANAATIVVNLATPVPMVIPSQAQMGGGNVWLILLGGIVVFIILLFILKKSQNRAKI